MKFLQDQERPRERCLRQGAENLSLRECLAVILGSGPPSVGCMGVAESLLPKSIQDEGEMLEQLSHERTFDGTRGLGEAGRARLLVCFELAKRYAAMHEAKKLAVREARSACDPLERRALKRIPWAERINPREWIGFVPLYNDGRVGAFCLIDRGMRSHVNFDVQLFFKLVLSSPHTIGVFLFHNHPSGWLQPSTDDKRLTSEVAQLCKRLHLFFAGHWIVAGARERRVEQDC